MVQLRLRQLTTSRALLHRSSSAGSNQKHLVPLTKSTLCSSSVQGIFFNLYFIVYLLWPKVCHAFVGECYFLSACMPPCDCGHPCPSRAIMI